MIKKLIYDVGMHNGDDTAYYLTQGFRVIAIEANPLLVEQASERFKQEISAGDVTILSIGISNYEGELPFFICDTLSIWSTFNLSVAKDKMNRYKNTTFHKVPIPCRRLRSVLDEFGTPYYLKLDIEGNELYCLQDLITSDLPLYISFEDTPITNECLTLLYNLGYTGFKRINQVNYLPVEYPPTREYRHYLTMLSLLNSKNFFIRVVRKAGARRWLERQLAQLNESSRRISRTGWIFPKDSSGPFGEDTPGKWQTFDEIMETMKKVKSFPNICWFDLHAKR